MCEYMVYIKLIYYYQWQTLFTFKSLFVTVTIASIDIVADECSFGFLPKAEFTSPLQQTLEAPSSRLSQLLHVNLVICLNKIIYF